MHATLTFKRDVSARPDKVFHAFADAALRASWSVPSDTAAVLYDIADFREGGVDRYRCGSKDELNIGVAVQYLEIIENTRIAYSETVASGGRRLSASLTTVEFEPSSAGTALQVTVQLASFIGQAMIEGHKAGNAAALDNLAKLFARGTGAKQRSAEGRAG